MTGFKVYAEENASMTEVTHSGKYHDYTVLIARIDAVLVSDRTTGLYDRPHTLLSGKINTISKGKKGI